MREYRDSDLDLLLALWNDPQVQSTGTRDYSTPKTTRWAMDVLVPQLQNSLLAVMIELKELPPDFFVDHPAGSRRSRIQGEQGRWPDDDKFVGYLLLQMGAPKNRDATLAVALFPYWWGRGFGKEAVRWAVDYGFRNLGLHRVSLVVMDGNERAIRLYKSLGFVEEGRKREGNWSHGEWKDYLMMGLVNHEWRVQMRAR